MVGDGVELAKILKLDQILKHDTVSPDTARYTVTYKSGMGSIPKMADIFSSSQTNTGQDIAIRRPEMQIRETSGGCSTSAVSVVVKSMIPAVLGPGEAHAPNVRTCRSSSAAVVNNETKRNSSTNYRIQCFNEISSG